MLKGVTKATKKDGTIYYRSSISIQSKHISLGSFEKEEQAHKAYLEAVAILRENAFHLEDYNDGFSLDFSKFITLLNYRNTGLYFKNPIYLQSGFFYYYLSMEQYLIFDREDLFYYANHKIQKRGNYYFIYDYGSQYNILSRYHIKNYAKKGIDYIFVNHNDSDFRYENIKVINEYMGVTERRDTSMQQNTYYECVIHIRGNYLVGRYPDKISAAIAYNKAIDTLKKNGIQKNYIKNYITELSSEEYRTYYNNISISPKIQNYTESFANCSHLCYNPYDSDK